MLYLAFMGSLVKVLLNVIFVVTCLFLIVMIVMRQGETGGLSTAFGGPGDTFLGARAAKTIDKVIRWSAVIFGLLSILLNLPTIQKLGQ